jgi:hypothetical protein
MSRAMPEWCADCGEIARLLRWLNEKEDIDVVGAIHIVEKPWHWDAEYQEMCASQNPLVTRDEVIGEERGNR